MKILLGKKCYVIVTLLILLTNRNLSSGKLANRQALRDCDGLIDSLTTHVLFCVENSSLDDKVVISANQDLVSFFNDK